MANAISPSRRLALACGVTSVPCLAAYGLMRLPLAVREGTLAIATAGAMLALWDCWRGLVPAGSASPRPSFRARSATLLRPAGVWMLLPVAAHLSSVRTASGHGWAVWWPGQLVPLLMIAAGVYASVPKPPEETVDAHRRLSQQVDDARRALVAGLALFATLVALGFLSVSVQAAWYGCFVVFGALAAFPLAFGGAIQLRQASRAALDSFWPPGR